MSRLSIVIAALVISGLLAATAGAMPLDGNPARSAALQRTYVNAPGTDVAAADQQAPATATSSAVSPSSSASRDSSGPDWALLIPVGVVLVVAAAGAGTMVGRAHARPGHRLA